MKFNLNEPVPWEESLIREFKEVKSQPLQVVGKVVDQYMVAFLNAAGGSIFWGIRDSDRVVTGLSASGKVRDELRQVIGQKLASIAPSVGTEWIQVPFHPVLDSSDEPLHDTCVLEVRVEKPVAPNLYLTGGGEAYIRTIGGVKKLSGAELYLALAVPLKAKVPSSQSASLIARLPSVYRRATLVHEIIRGRRVLWVDDNPSYNFHERVALAEIGVAADVAISTSEALQAVTRLNPDLIVSDMERHGQEDAGLELLTSLSTHGLTVPVIFYVGRVEKERGTPPGAFGIADRPDEVLHLILDALERNAS